MRNVAQDFFVGKKRKLRMSVAKQTQKRGELLRRPESYYDWFAAVGLLT
jgi:hypothetical protein